MTSTLVTIFLSYLLGSIPFGLLLVHYFHGEDVRTSGSGNIGGHQRGQTITGSWGCNTSSGCRQRFHRSRNCAHSVSGTSAAAGNDACRCLRSRRTPFSRVATIPWRQRRRNQPGIIRADRPQVYPVSNRGIRGRSCGHALCLAGVGLCSGGVSGGRMGPARV